MHHRQGKLHHVRRRRRSSGKVTAFSPTIETKSIFAETVFSLFPFDYLPLPMVQLRSGTALDAGITEVPKHQRRNSDASTGSGDSGNSSDIIEYDELETVQDKRPKQFRTTKQKVDRRAPSTFVSDKREREDKAQGRRSGLRRIY